eukprot:138299-Rhodomonas_salina.1
MAEESERMDTGKVMAREGREAERQRQISASTCLALFPCCRSLASPVLRILKKAMLKGGEDETGRNNSPRRKNLSRGKWWRRKREGEQEAYVVVRKRRGEKRKRARADDDCISIVED